MLECCSAKVLCEINLSPNPEKRKFYYIPWKLLRRFYLLHLFYRITLPNPGNFPFFELIECHPGRSVVFEVQNEIQEFTV